MVPSATTTDILFHCPSCATEMCVAAEFLNVAGPCITCGTVTSAQQALIHSAQQRLMECSAPPVYTEPPALADPSTNDGRFESHNGGADLEVLSTQDLENGDSWLLPEAQYSESLTIQPPIAEPNEINADSEFFEPQASTPLELLTSARSSDQVAAAPRDAALHSFGDTSLIDKEFLKKQSLSQLPLPRSEGVAPRLEDAGSPFVPNRVIAASGDTDSSWKEKHRRKGRSRRRRRSAEKKIDRLADNPAWGVVRGVLAIAAVLIMACTIIWIVKNPRGFAAGFQANNKESRILDESTDSVLAESVAEDALSRDMGIPDSDEDLDQLILDEGIEEVESLELSENLDFGY